MDEHPEFQDSLRIIADQARCDEDACLESLIPAARLSEDERKAVAARATSWIEQVRQTYLPDSSITEPLARSGLSGDEGLPVLLLAESLLRIPDQATVDALISDKLSDTHWDALLSDKSGLNLKGKALSLGGKLLGLGKNDAGEPGPFWGRVAARLGRPVVREIARKLVAGIVHRFVPGTEIEALVPVADELAHQGASVVFCPLGEDARCQADVDRYANEILAAIEKIGAWCKTTAQKGKCGISIKLSALHPRYETAQLGWVLAQVPEQLKLFVERAAANNLELIFDAEDSSRFYVNLHCLAALLPLLTTEQKNALGFVIQAYDKRTNALINALADLAKEHACRLGVRLVKGSYWDKEIRRAQEQGWDDFTVFTRKASTDISYIAAARQLFAADAFLRPSFATHNALTIATLVQIAPSPQSLKFDNLCGMADELFALLRADGILTSTSLPYGSAGLTTSYISRRLVETESTSSFIHDLYDLTVAPDTLTQDPVAELCAYTQKRHPLIRRGHELFAPERQNASGLDLQDPFVLSDLLDEVDAFAHKDYTAVPLIMGDKFGPADHVTQIRNPATGAVVGEALAATQSHIETAFDAAQKHFGEWARTSVEQRAHILEKLADLVEENRAELISLLIRESGKTLADSLAEVRETVNTCRLYALFARQNLVSRSFPAPVGEQIELQMQGRGVFVCISPWHFPLSVFVGQSAAALVAGNSVIAKPATQTPLIAAYAAALILESGVPPEVFHLLPGGAQVGAMLLQHPSLAGVAFTGSADSAHYVNQALAHREGPIVPLIASTSSHNILIVDTTARREDVVDDVVASAFRSAGQCCASLNLLCVPHDTADEILDLLRGALATLVVGDPAKAETDVGPVIDTTTRARLLDYISALEQDAKCVARRACDKACLDGCFIEPQVWEIASLDQVRQPVFGPLLHVLRYDAGHLDELIASANKLGLNLTGGIQTRIDSVRRNVAQSLQSGHFYANKISTPSTVEVASYGNESYASSGALAGGPHYLFAFARERLVSTGLTAAGGDADLIDLAGERD